MTIRSFGLAMSGRPDRGSADALGLVLIAPAVVGLAVLIAALGRNVDAQAQARSAAEAGAQAAALERTPAAATATAQRLIAQMLTDRDSCPQPTVEVDTSTFRPGGAVAVMVECRVSNRGITSVQPGDTTLSARAVAHIDQFRSTGAAP